MAVAYVEFPVDPVVRIVVPKKPDGGPGGGPDDGGPPCGAATFTDGLWMSPGFYVLHPNGLYALVGGISTGGGVSGFNLIYTPLYETHVTPDGGHMSPPYVPYLWSSPNQFIVTAETQTFAEEGFAVDLPYTLKVWRNRDPLTFNPCTDDPDMQIAGGPGADSVTLTVDAKSGSELHPPIFMDTGGTGNCHQAGVVIHIQSICENQTSDEPPKPDGWTGAVIGIFLGPPGPGSYFTSGG